MNNENKSNSNRVKLFLVDDDALFLKLLEIEFLEHADFDIETFATGELCLKNLSHGPDVIILFYQVLLFRSLRSYQCHQGDNPK